AQANVQIAIIALLEATCPAAVEDVEGIDPPRQDTRHVLVSVGVVTPHHGPPLRPRLVDARTQGPIVIPHPGDPRAKTHRTDEVFDVEEHNVAITLPKPVEVVAVLLAIVEQHSRRPKALQVSHWITVGDVLPII